MSTPSSPAACVFCREPNTLLAFSLPTSENFLAQFYRCAHCRSLQLRPRPGPEILSRAYAETYYGARAERKFVAPLERLIEGFRRKRASILLAVLPQRARVLDVGCGNGQFLNYLIQAGCQGEGVELSGPAAERAKTIPGILLHEASFDMLRFQPDSFDGISLWHVFEHLPDPPAVHDSLRAMLRSGGYLALSFPNAGSLQAQIFGRHWFHLDPPRHLTIPSAEGFLKLFGPEEFEVLRTQHFSLEQNVFGVLQSMLNCLSPKREIFYESLKGRKGTELGVSRSLLLIQWILAVLLLPLALAFSLLEALLGKGGTVEFLLRRK